MDIDEKFLTLKSRKKKIKIPEVPPTRIIPSNSSFLLNS